MRAILHSDILHHVIKSDLDLSHFNREGSSCIGHCLIGIGAEVHDDLVDLSRITLDRPALFIQIAMNFDGCRD